MRGEKLESLKENEKAQCWIRYKADVFLQNSYMRILKLGHMFITLLFRNLFMQSMRAGYPPENLHRWTEKGKISI